MSAAIYAPMLKSSKYKGLYVRSHLRFNFQSPLRDHRVVSVSLLVLLPIAAPSETWIDLSHRHLRHWMTRKVGIDANVP